ncbi:MAG: DMT family transporter [Fibrobacterota bacterium]
MARIVRKGAQQKLILFLWKRLRSRERTHILQRGNEDVPMYWLLAFLSAMLFGAATPFSKFLLSNLDPFMLAGLFYVGASLALFPSTVWLQKKKPLERPAKKDLFHLMGSLFWGGMVGPVLLLFGLRMTEASTASLLLTAETPATAIVAFFFFRENMGKRAVLANAGMILVGAMLAFEGTLTLSAGGILIVLACVAWSLDNNHTASIHGIDPIRCTFLKGATFGLVNIAIAVILGNTPGAPKSMLLALLVGAFAYGLSIVLYITSARRLGASRSQMVFATAPFIGVLISQTYLNEPLHSYQIGGAILIAASLILLFTEKHLHSHLHARMEHTHRHSHDDPHHDHHRDLLGTQPTHDHVHTHAEATHVHRHLPDIHHRHAH